MVWVIVFIVISWIVGMGSLGIGRSVVRRGCPSTYFAASFIQTRSKGQTRHSLKGLGETGGTFVVNVVLEAEQHCVGTRHRDALSSPLSNPSLECQSTHESAD